MLLTHLGEMVHGVYEGEPGLVVRVQEAVVVLVKRRSVETPAILSQDVVVLHFVKGKVFSMLPAKLTKISIAM